MEREKINNIISNIDPTWTKENLQGYTNDKKNELIDYIYKIINGDISEPASRSYLKSTCITRNLRITREVIRDILLTIGVGGHIARFSTTATELINKNIPFENLNQK